MKIINVCGARPNFMKIAPLMRAFASRPGIEPFLLHTGQHYDENMNRSFFEALNIPKPDANLEVGSGSHAAQTAAIMQRFEPVLLEQKPDAVLVVGDVNSTVACALVSVKLGVPIIHVEAGLRSFDRTMPEEINRLVTDTLSELLFVTERSGVENLTREGVDPAKIHLVGNVMIDTLREHEQLSRESRVLDDLKLTAREYAVLTLHRPANVDDPERFAGICDALDHVQRTHTVVFPVHPRTLANLKRNGLHDRLSAMPNMRLAEPLGYLDFLRLMSDAAVVLTDSGGIQEETTVLGVPCLTLRDNTERPVTIEQGTNELVGTTPDRIIAAFDRSREASRAVRIPELWDGRAGERIADLILEWGRARSVQG
ncbi:MAG: UDP-N-acetylglucosamine 2-epimerase (non-hydrolyzing) [Planctomycetes bacterium]|nr:UDP-N-acetylglucosamine 2-epimerase (non-hydrolyzing) [Planctomycetota bacterium]